MARLKHAACGRILLFVVFVLFVRPLTPSICASAIKLYRPETAIEFLASLGLSAVVVDLTSCREHHIAIQP